MNIQPLTDKEFYSFKSLIYKLAGINLSEEKRALVAGRLQKRLRYYGFDTYSQYYNLVTNGNEVEKQTMVDLLTTNETYFFREPDHFDFLRDLVQGEWQSRNNLRIWSAACSTGEEVYSIAMILAEYSKGARWEVVGTDINGDVVNRAARGVYPMDRVKETPQNLLRKYCLRGVRTKEGLCKVQSFLQKNVTFERTNLLHIEVDLGIFDIVFLRNVMIYFDRETRRKVIDNISRHLYDDGYLILGHSESLLGVTDKMKSVRPTIYQKVAGGKVA